MLKQTFHRVQNEGRPALVTVVGPAGVGKTRLVRELERYVEAHARVRLLAPRAVPRVRQHVVLGARRRDQGAVRDPRGRRHRRRAEEDRGRRPRSSSATPRSRPQIGALVGAGEPGSFSREDLFEAWRRFLERMAARYPLVLVFEDIHWADEGLLDFIEHLADWAQGPILVVTLARPELFETRPSWGGGKRNAASISSTRCRPTRARRCSTTCSPAA